MDNKKRKHDDNGSSSSGDEASAAASVASEDLRRLVGLLGNDHLVDILSDAASRYSDVMDEVRRVADLDTASRKLFIRGLGWETKASHLQEAFKGFGEIEEAHVIVDKTTGKSKGYGFVTMKHAEDAHRALREPAKKIDGRNTICQLASTGPPTNQSQAGPAGGATEDESARKIYVGSVPTDTTSEKLLSIFSKYGELDKGPLGFDKKTGKCKGFALFLYKTAASARRAVEQSVKEIDGHKIHCKMASDGGKNQKPGTESANTDPNLVSGLTLNALAAAGLLNSYDPTQSFNPGLNQFGLAGLNPSMAHQLGLSQSLNYPMSSSLLSSLNPGSSQNLGQPGMSAYDLHGMGSYGSQLQGLGSSQSGGGGGGYDVGSGAYQGGGGVHPLASLALARGPSYPSY